MASTTTSTPSASAPAANLSSLPFELIKAIFEQCDDYFTLHALRQTCKTFQKTIDNNPVFDKYLFRNRPITNPAVTRADLIEIRRLARTEENTYRAGYRISNRHIKVHPILSQFGWSLYERYDDDDDDDDDEDDDETDDETDDEDEDDDDEFPFYRHTQSTLHDKVYIWNSDLTIKDIPHILDQCATCPPVSTIELDLDLGKLDSIKEWPIPKHNPIRISHGGPKMSSSANNNRHDQQPVLVRDVINCLHPFSRNLYRVFHNRMCDDPCYDPWDEAFASPSDFETGCPSVSIRRDGLLRLAFASKIAP